VTLRSAEFARCSALLTFGFELVTFRFALRAVFHFPLPNHSNDSSHMLATRNLTTLNLLPKLFANFFDVYHSVSSVSATRLPFKPSSVSAGRKSAGEKYPAECRA
jgi:hypothetical protein